MSDKTDQVDDSDADFEAGFNSVRGIETAPKTQPDPQASEPAEAQPATEASEPANAEDGIANVEQSTAEAVEPEKREPTTSELMTVINELQKSVRNVAGNFGGLKSEFQRELQKIAQLQQVRETQPQGSPAAEGAKKAQALLLKRVRENWPDFADDLAADLAETIGAAPAAPAPEEIERRVSSRVSQEVSKVQQEMASDTMDLLMPDWKSTISTKDQSGNVVMDGQGRLIPSREFASWLQTKGDDFRSTFWSTNSPKFLIGAVKEYKESLAKVKEAQKGKQARLQAAVVPQGRGGTVPQAELDEEALMNRGFASVRGAHR